MSLHHFVLHNIKDTIFFVHNKKITYFITRLEYMYAFLTRKEDTAYMVLRVEDNEKAADILSKSGIHTICQDAVANL